MDATSLERVDNQAKHVLISMNPRSGSSNRRSLVMRLQDELNARGLVTEVLTDIDVLSAKSQELIASQQLRTVVSAGGDGTASLLVNTLDPAIPLTIFPLGTANLLAQFVDASTDIEKTVNTIAAGRLIRMDAGSANGRIFLVVASCGFDADVVDRIHRGRRGHITYWSYGIPMLHSICRYRYPPMRLIADGKPLNPACWTFVLNVPKYALGLQFVAGADASDGLLDVCTFRSGGFFRGLFYFFAVLFRRHARLKATQFAKFSELKIEADVRIPYELDGDPGAVCR